MDPLHPSLHSHVCARSQWHGRLLPQLFPAHPTGGAGCSCCPHADPAEPGLAAPAEVAIQTSANGQVPSTRSSKTQMVAACDVCSLLPTPHMILQHA